MRVIRYHIEEEMERIAPSSYFLADRFRVFGPDSVFLWGQPLPTLLSWALSPSDWPLLQTQQKVTRIRLAVLDLAPSITKTNLDPTRLLSFSPALIPTMFGPATGLSFCLGFCLHPRSWTLDHSVVALKICLDLTVFFFSEIPFSPCLGCVFKQNTTPITTMLTVSLTIL